MHYKITYWDGTTWLRKVSFHTSVPLVFNNPKTRNPKYQQPATLVLKQLGFSIKGSYILEIDQQ